MNTLLKQTPLHPFRNNLEAFTNLFNEQLAVPQKNNPRVNIAESKEFFEVQVALPGYSKNQITVDFEDQLLVISAQVNTTTEEVGRKQLKKEFDTPEFTRKFNFEKQQLNAQEIRANFENGVLIIHLPKLQVSNQEKHKIVIQ